MKHLLMIAALALPVAAGATPTPIDELEAAQATPRFEVTLAAAPALPFVSPEEAGYCGQRLDPLPDVIALHLVEEVSTLVALCVVE